MLVAINLLGWWFFIEFVDPLHHHPVGDRWFRNVVELFLEAFPLSLALPVSLIPDVLVPESVRFVRFFNPLLWAACIEWGLRRFVDRPSDPDAE